MLPKEQVTALIAPYGLELVDNGTRIRSTQFEFGTLSIETIYEMMFLHNVPRDQALKDVALLLNVGKPEHQKKKIEEKKPLKKKALQK